MSEKNLVFQDLGLIDYQQALKVQMAAVDEVILGGRERVLLLEHPEVITVGRNQAGEKIFSSSAGDYRDVPVVQCSRGGMATCHFPGQLVAYPVMKLDRRPGGVREYFFSLEQAVINLLQRYGIDSFRKNGKAGVFTASGKIASMGIAVKKWVSYHGLAINLSRDLSLFGCIIPCGFKDVQMSSVHGELDSDWPDMKHFKEQFAAEFKMAFCEGRSGMADKC